MIIFYNKITRAIEGIIYGRVHDKHTLEKVWVGDKNRTNKYIVPLKKTTNERIPDVPFVDFIYDFEDRKKDIHTYKVKLNNKKKIIGFEKKLKNE